MIDPRPSSHRCRCVAAALRRFPASPTSLAQTTSPTASRPARSRSSGPRTSERFSSTPCTAIRLNSIATISQPRRSRSSSPTWPCCCVCPSSCSTTTRTTLTTDDTTTTRQRPRPQPHNTSALRPPRPTTTTKRPRRPRRRDPHHAIDLAARSRHGSSKRKVRNQRLQPDVAGRVHEADSSWLAPRHKPVLVQEVPPEAAIVVALCGHHRDPGWAAHRGTAGRLGL